MNFLAFLLSAVLGCFQACVIISCTMYRALHPVATYYVYYGITLFSHTFLSLAELLPLRSFRIARSAFRSFRTVAVRYMSHKLRIGRRCCFCRWISLRCPGKLKLIILSFVLFFMT